MINETIRIHRENLIMALGEAIKQRREYERKQLGYAMDSALLYGWVELEAAVRDGADIQFFNEP